MVSFVGRLPRRVVMVACLTATVLVVTFWVTWFLERDLLASEHRSAYYTFENAFPLADGWLASCNLAAFVSLRRRRESALLWLIAAGSAAAFLTGMDMLYDLENGIYAKGGPALVELAVNVLSGLFALVAPTWAWARRSALSSPNPRQGHHG